MNEDNYGFLNKESEITKINEFDSLLFGKKQSVLTFIRNKKHLYFRTSPSKDSFRHIDFIKNESDFKLLSMLISQIFGLGGHLEENTKDYYRWDFTKENIGTPDIPLGPYIVFSPSIGSVRIYGKGKTEALFSGTLNLRNETDLFQCANLIAALLNMVARPMLSKEKGDIAYRFLEI